MALKLTEEKHKYDIDLIDREGKVYKKIMSNGIQDVQYQVSRIVRAMQYGWYAGQDPEGRCERIIISRNRKDKFWAKQVTEVEMK